MKQRLIRTLLRWLGYKPPCIIVPRGSSLLLTARGPIELRAGALGREDLPLFIVEGDLTLDGGEWLGGSFEGRP